MPKFVGAIDVNGAYTLPTADGSANQVLKTDGSGTVSFANEAGGGGSPGGSNTHIQFNNSDSFGGSANFTFDGTSTVTLASTDAGSSAAPIIELYRNSSSPADADYLGQIKFQGENDAGGKVVYAKITAKIDDASDTTEDGIIEIAHHKAGSNNISARFTSTALKLINGTGIEIADGLLTLGSTAVTATAAELNILDGVTATASELNILDGVTSTTAELNILDGVTSTASELNLVDGITAGTVSASKAVIADSNKDVTGFRNVTLTGELDAATLDISGDADIDGTTNLDVVDIDGQLTISDGSAGAPALAFGSDTDSGIYITTDTNLDGATIAAVGISTDGTQRMTIGDDLVNFHNLKLVTSDIIDVNEVRGDNGSDTDPSFTFTDDGDTGMYRYAANKLGFTVGGDAIGYFQQGDGSGYGGLVIEDTSETISDGGIRIGTWKDSTYSGIFMDGHTGSEYMMISNGGATYISASSGSSVLIRAGANQSGNEITVGDGVLEFDFASYVKWNTPLPVVSGYSTLRRKNSTLVVGYDGSSIRYKENVTPFVKSDWEKIYNLQAVRFNWKAEIDEEQNRSWGFISEDVYEQIPELGVMRVVEGVNDGNPVPDTVNYEQMCVFLVEAIKDLNTRLTALEG